MKKLITLMALLIASFSLTANEAAKEPPLDPKYMGVQKFVLLANNTTIYAYNLATYDKPKNYQILYKVTSIPTALRIMVRDAQADGSQVTVITKPFNLERMLRGHDFEVTGEVYLGHFDRGGMSVYPELTMNLSEKLYVRELTELDPSSNRHIYDEIRLDQTTKILVKQVTMAPSFANVILFDDDRSCVKEFYTSSSTPSQNELFMKLTLCGSIKPMYFEVEDFSS